MRNIYEVIFPYVEVVEKLKHFTFYFFFIALLIFCNFMLI